MGFTMIEILVVITTVTILTAVVLLYNHQGESQLILFKEQSRLLSEISRAKVFSVETFNQSGVPCGFGIHFVDVKTYILYKDIAPDCSTSDNRYSATSADQVVATTVIDSAVSFGALPISDILFVPPDPKVFIDGVADFSGVATIPLVSTTGTELDVKINGAGQITI